MATKSSKGGHHSRASSTIVPAVPNIFNKTTAAPSRAPVPVPSADRQAARVAAKQESASRGGEQTPLKDGRPLQSVADGVGIRKEAEDSTLGEQVSTPRPSVAVTDVGNPSGRRPRVSLPKHDHYGRAAAHATSQAPPRASASTSRNSRSHVKSTSMPSRPPHSRSVHRIAFGSFGNPSESSESSPTIPPSATSTHYTQPTPVSDARSQASRSDIEHRLAGQPSDKMSLLNAGPAHETGLVGPYPPGLMGGHALRFLEYQQQYLVQYVHDLYGRNDGDVTLEICFEDDSMTYNLHSAILFQSPMLAKAIQQSRELSRFSAPGRTLVTLLVRDKFVTVRAVESVLMSMYGRPSMDLDELNQPFLDPHIFYAYFASSCLLGVPTSQGFGTNCILDILSWCTLADVFDLCLTGDESSPVYDPFPRRSEEIVTRLFQPHVIRIFDQALSILIHEVNQPDFSFDAAVSNIAFLGGLPRSESSVDTPASPVAAATRPSEPISEPVAVSGSSKHSVLSSLLISLPLSVLQRVMGGVSMGSASGVVEKAVGERERRRVAWSTASSNGGAAGMREICVPVELLPNGIGIINDMS